LIALARRRAVLALVLLAIGLGVWSTAFEPQRLTVQRAEITLPHWPRELDGLTLALISDVHGGAPYVSVLKLRELVALTNRERPDLVFLLGDYVIQGVLGGRFMPPETTARELGALRARLGRFAVLGNHDHWLDAARVSAAFEAATIPVVDGMRVRLVDNGRALSILGLGDAWTVRPDVGAVTRQIPDGEAALLLTHNPDVFPSIPASVDLVLAGHTHGGQIALPWIGALIVPARRAYARGHVVEGGRHLFVTSGVGTSIIPVRFRVPPEIALVRLRAPSVGETMPAR
jgi:predicted MPP superfamily phosphohydrolase